MRTHDIVGRGPEMAKLDKLLLSGRPEFLALYGRRRVGKTFLIRQHLQNQYYWQEIDTEITMDKLFEP